MSIEDQKIENYQNRHTELRKFTYRDNSAGRKVLFECVANGILEADILYEKETGKNPEKQNHVVCSIEDTEPVTMKPEFLYHGSNVPNIEAIEPRKRYTPSSSPDVPERVYAGDLPAFAAAHAFPWGSNEGFVLSIEGGKVVFKVPFKFKSRLMQEIYLYKIPSDKFELTSGEGTGHTYHSQGVINSVETQKFNSVQDAIEHFGGEVVYI